MTKMLKDMTKTLFEKIIDREIPAQIRYEDADFIAFDDISPRAPIHVLLVPKKPYATLEEVPESESAFYGQLIQTARKVAQQLGIADNYKLFMNVGQRVQSVAHLHLHIMGGWGKEKTLQDLDRSEAALVNDSGTSRE
jgi:histidine triad (HIT) family protein